ncbi:MAG TPA: hypothetical protein VJ997_10835 [Longimicrobiales bacterium]|nr:hypothetical protein [Longimicrobiales bacterium]
MKAINDVNSLGSRDGFALLLTMIVVVVMVALISGAVMVGGNHQLAERYYERGSVLDAVAKSGLELARARINGNASLYPDSGYATLENGVTVKDGAGATIPGIKRWTYVGPTGLTAGQYGIFGSIVTVVRDDGGGEVVRRTEIFQESFARFVYFTDVEGSIYFNGDSFWGPVHSNDQLKLSGYPSFFHNDVTTAKTVKTPSLGTFDQGYEENVSVIPLPSTTEIAKLQGYAAIGGTSFTGDSNGNDSEATTRIEFVAVDLNGDTDTTDDDEGFFKVYKSSNVVWLSGYYDGDVRDNGNCGRWYSGTFVPMADHPYAGISAQTASLKGDAICYLGGDARITNGFVANDGKGSWLPWTGTVAPGLAGRPDAGYLFPLARRYNPNFKGVIAVSGKVGVSGTVRGRVTVVATDDIIILDDLQYATPPAVGTCQDMVGLFAGDDVMVAHSLMNAAQRPYSTQAWHTYDDTGDEFIDSVILALDQFGAAEPSAGAAVNENCLADPGGRGCLFVTGGIIQRARGAVGNGAYGYWKKYSWDACALSAPPPYFPTTEQFRKGRQFDVDPTGFSVANYFASLTPS